MLVVMLGATTFVICQAGLVDRAAARELHRITRLLQRTRKLRFLAAEQQSRCRIMNLLEIVRESWGFTGPVPARILDTNAFGNVLVEDVGGQLWRICPEELSCEPVGTSMDEFQALRSSTDWTMERLVVLATASLGTPADGRCFCLKIPAVLGGTYEVENFGTITVEELIAFSGDVAFQIKDLPDGAQVKLKIVD